MRLAMAKPIFRDRGGAAEIGVSPAGGPARAGRSFVLQAASERLRGMASPISEVEIGEPALAASVCGARTIGKNCSTAFSRRAGFNRLVQRNSAAPWQS